MDYERICSQKGYRREDLSKEDQSILRAIDFIAERVECLKSNVEYIDEECIEETVMGKLKSELYQKAIDSVLEEIRTTQLEMQIGLAEYNE